MYSFDEKKTLKLWVFTLKHMLFYKASSFNIYKNNVSTTGVLDLVFSSNKKIKHSKFINFWTSICTVHIMYNIQ